MVEWKNERIVEWDACSKHVGGEEVEVWAALFEMESLDLEVDENVGGGSGQARSRRRS